METGWIARHFDDALKQQRLDEKRKCDERAVITGKRESSFTLFGQLVDTIANDVEDWNESHPSQQFLVRRTRDLCEVSVHGELKAEMRLDITKEGDIHWISPERLLSRYMKREEKDGLIWVKSEPDPSLYWNELPECPQITPEEVSMRLLDHITSLRVD